MCYVHCQNVLCPYLDTIILFVSNCSMSILVSTFHNTLVLFIYCWQHLEARNLNKVSTSLLLLCIIGNIKPSNSIKLMHCGACCESNLAVDNFVFENGENGKKVEHVLRGLVRSKF